MAARDENTPTTRIRRRASSLSKLVDVDKREAVLGATVPKTRSGAGDREKALELIGAQTIRQHRLFWSHEVSSDAAFDKRQARIAERRAIQRIDREIVTALVDGLLTKGFSISCCLLGGHPVLKRSVKKLAILEVLFDLDSAVLLVHRESETSWIESHSTSRDGTWCVTTRPTSRT